ncbi:lysozyme [Streptomyces sp. JJ38]|uniref:lysozyme n=1 Tax=Streptomyces sp. JJ38 TaxID=2738128 RepID=UPI001C565965|nr:lysozyme [Streptomyces sp. JJ38]MBW1598603.1 lysozyme [Streptomyces sp. JJ38]
MPAYRSPSPRHTRRPRPRTAALLGVVTAVIALVLTLAVPASAAQPPRPPGPGERVEPGHAYMGVGTRIEQGRDSGHDTDITPADTSGVQGIDVSHWQGYINWNSVRAAGIDFAYIKATEGTSFKDSRFGQNYTNAYYAGLVRGAYHFARPNYSSGATQANFFASNGGAWSADSQTLPGVLDIEHNPSGSMCYGLSTTQMRNWIYDFYTTYKYRTGRDIVIYTTASWWNTCTGYWSGMYDKAPLWVAHWHVSSPTIPSGFPTWTFWQYTATGRVGGVSGDVDRNKFNGSMSRLLALANNTA